MSIQVNISEKRANRPDKKSAVRRTRKLSDKGDEPLPDFNEAGEDAFQARIVDRMMKDPKAFGMEGKSRAEIFKLVEESEARDDARWLEEELKKPSRLLGVEETRKFLKEQGLE